MLKKLSLIVLVIPLLCFSCLIKQPESVEDKNIHDQELNQFDVYDSNKQNNISLKEAYEIGDYDQALHHLKKGANGRVLLSDGKTRSVKKLSDT